MNPTDQTLGLLKGVYEGGLAKAGNTVTTGTGLVAYDLQAPSKNLYPVITILGKRIPRVRGKGGTATNWRQVNSIIGSGWDNSGWVPEGQRAGVMSLNASNKAASYATLGEEGALTFEAVSAAKGFEDERSLVSMRVLQKAMLKEEAAILGGNASLALGTANTPTLSATGTGASLPTATYSVIVVGLTFEGYQNSSVANGVATSKTVTGQDGQTFPLNGGSGMKSTNATQAVTLGQTLTATVVAKSGELAWAWFVGTAGSEKLQSITTVPSATFSAPLNSGSQAATAVTADSSQNANTAFDGLLTTAFNSGTAYTKQFAGATLTASGRGTVVEIDTMLRALWDQYRVSPSILLVNSQEQNNITTKVLSGSTANSVTPLLRQNVTVGGDGEIRAGQVVSFYYNPFCLGQGKMIPVVLHPNVPPGTILAYAEDLPAQYQNDNVPNVAEMHIRRDWYDIEWPPVTRSYQHGIYVEEVLAVYAPFAMAVLSGIGNG
ncbi:MAG: hypothetical protein B7Z78_13810 [Rhodospirillales bacterium 20-60-12]|nr:MAG: hypothetical protein B7Z78_13810 [Rhodospirillales bacterium 20-60-12]